MASYGQGTAGHHPVGRGRGPLPFRHGGIVDRATGDRASPLCRTVARGGSPRRASRRAVGGIRPCRQGPGGIPRRRVAPVPGGPRSGPHRIDGTGWPPLRRPWTWFGGLRGRCGTWGPHQEGRGSFGHRGRATPAGNGRGRGVPRHRRPDRGYFPAINAATLSLVAGDRPGSRELARVAPDRVAASGDPGYFGAATGAEARLLLGDQPEAQAALDRAGRLHDGDFGALSTTRRQLRLVCSLTGTEPASCTPLSGRRWPATAVT